MVRVNSNSLSTSLQGTNATASLPTVLKRNCFGYPGFFHKLEQHLVFKESQAFQEPITKGPNDSWIEQPAGTNPPGECLWTKSDPQTSYSFVQIRRLGKIVLFTGLRNDLNPIGTPLPVKMLFPSESPAPCPHSSSWDPGEARRMRLSRHQRLWGTGAQWRGAVNEHLCLCFLHNPFFRIPDSKPCQNTLLPSVCHQNSFLAKTRWDFMLFICPSCMYVCFTAEIRTDGFDYGEVLLLQNVT